MRLVVGLTGGIGSGKSAAAEHFARLGAAIVDTDAIAHALTGPGGAAMGAIAEAFGASVLAADGALDRAAMRALVFEDPGARARLEAILHPAIRARSDEALAAARGAYSILVVPLLFETGNRARRVARTLVVDCAPQLQRERAMRRSGLAAAQVEAIMAAQWPRWRRLQVADDVAWNGASLAVLHAQCDRLHARYVQMAGSAQ